MGLLDRIKSGWNAFKGMEQRLDQPYSYGIGYGSRPDRTRLHFQNERSLVGAIYSRIAVDVAGINFSHVRLDDNGRFKEPMDSGLNDCLTLEANIDQTPTAFKIDAVLSLCDKGHIAIVPVDTSYNPLSTGGYDIYTMRVGEVVQWYPRHVDILLWNDRLGEKKVIRGVPKDMVAIVENPLGSIMNEPNSTLQRLIRKLNILDAIDEQAGSGKLDIIIQLPYMVRNETKRQQALDRKHDLEEQLQDSKYGIGYIDATERITQLNRPAENNLLATITYLTNMLYGQLGITEEILLGTADEQAMLNYYNRTVEPIVRAITEEMHRKFLTKTARRQKQAVIYFRDPFKLVPVSMIAEISDKFTRNEIATANEIRGLVGWKPVADPKADQLRNANLSEPANQLEEEKDALPKDENKQIEEKEGVRQDEA